MSEVIEAEDVWVEVVANLPGAVSAALTEWAVANPDEEICGFILEDGTIVQIKNVFENPRYGFEMDKDEMMAVIHGQTPIAATYHSHPSGLSTPSAGDSERMTYLYQQGCPWRYLIVTAAGVYEYRHKDRAV